MLILITTHQRVDIDHKKNNFAFQDKSLPHYSSPHVRTPCAYNWKELRGLDIPSQSNTLLASVTYNMNVSHELKLCNYKYVS